MNIRIYEGKNEEDLINKALDELKLTKEEVLYSFTKEKVGLLKKEVIKMMLLTQDDIISYSKEYLNQLLTLMKLDVSFEVKKRDNQIYINMISSNNSILIGKNGQTIQSLNYVLKQSIYNMINVIPHITLDAGSYKEGKDKRLEHLALKLAKEVAKTKQDIELENMNSYDRRIIHNILSDNKNVYTISEGVEPNRHIIIKSKEE